MPIEAILFDLGKVLVDFDYRPVLRSMMNCCTRPADQVQIEKILRDQDLVRRYECGKMTTSEFHRYVCAAGALDMPLADFLDAWSSMFLPDSIVSEELILGLKKRYPLLLISNTNEAHAEFLLRRYRVLDYFDHRVFSFEVGSMKPDPAIYERAIALSGKPTNALFFIDDREENVSAARAIGLHAHRFSSEPELIESLRKAGVEVGN
jgi:HAD superfamily hydrolase (TIGR01509 family)